MLDSVKIAITGPLGSGKSFVCQCLRDFGFCTFSADEIVHQLLKEDEECIQKVRALLGDFVIVDHQVDRSKVASLVFSNREKLLQLEQIIHPLVLKKMTQLYKEKAQSNQNGLFFVEVPLLFEAGWESFFDKVIVVTASESLCRNRAKLKGMQDSEYNSRYQRLVSEEERLKKADFIIHNNSDKEEIKCQIKTILHTLDDKLM